MVSGDWQWWWWWNRCAIVWWEECEGFWWPSGWTWRNEAETPKAGQCISNWASCDFREKNEDGRVLVHDDGWRMSAAKSWTEIDYRDLCRLRTVRTLYASVAFKVVPVSSSRANISNKNATLHTKPIKTTGSDTWAIISTFILFYLCVVRLRTKATFKVIRANAHHPFKCWWSFAELLFLFVLRFLSID